MTDARRLADLSTLVKMSVSRHPPTLKIENRGNLTKESLTTMNYDPKQTSALIEKMMEQARLLTPQAKQELLRSLTQA